MNFEEKNELFKCLKKNFTSAEVRKEIIIRAIKRKFSLDDFELRSILGVFSLKKLEDLLDSIFTNDKKMTDILKILATKNHKEGFSEPYYHRLRSYGLLQSKPIPLCFQFDSFRVYLRLWDLSLETSNERARILGADTLFSFFVVDLCETLIPTFNTTRFVSILQFLFGPGRNYDEYKSSFGYLFHLFIERGGNNFEYIMGLTDKKGGWDIFFGRIEENNTIEDWFQEPKPAIPEEFSEEDMIRFSVAFFIFLKDYHEMSSLFKPPFFVKNNRYTNTLYGYNENGYFEEDLTE